MGIEKFFTTASKSKIITLDSTNDPVKQYEFNQFPQMNTTHLYIDFTSIVYEVSSKVISDLNLIIKIKLVPELVSRPSSIIDNLPFIGDKYGDIQTKYGQYFEEKISIIAELELKKLQQLLASKANLIIEDLIVQATIKLIDTVANRNKLKLVSICFDGIPSYSKIMEQIHRRYMTKMMELVDKQILKSNEKNMNKSRYMYETNKIDWDMSSINFDNVADKFKEFKEFRISTKNEYGEAEMKVIQQIKKDILNRNIDENSVITIYSPDADVIILGGIVYTWIMSNFKTVKNINRINVLNKQFDLKENKSYMYIININEFCNNIFSFIFKDLKAIRFLDKSSTINDILIIFTIFGNDFLPKFITLDVSEHFDAIIEAYKKIMMDKQVNHLLIYVDSYKKKILNGDTLLRILNVFQDFEQTTINIQQIKETYTSQGIRTIYNSVSDNKLQKDSVIDWNLLIANLEQFYKKLDMLNEQIKTASSDPKFYDELVSAYETYSGTEKIVLVKSWTNEAEFLNNLRDLSHYNLSTHPYNYKTDFYAMYDMKQKQVIDNRLDHRLFLIIYALNYIENHFDNNKFPAINFNRYKKEYKISSYPFNDNFNAEMTKRNLTKETVSDYDIELYKFQNMLDDYQEVLHRRSIKLCGYSLDTNGVNQSATFKKCQNEDEVKKEFYKVNFGGSDLDTICQNYLDGLIWVTEYYFVHHLENMTSVWYYPYHYSPLVKDVTKYLSTQSRQKIEKSYKSIEQSNRGLDGYLTHDEHKLLIYHMYDPRKVLTGKSVDLITKVESSHILPTGHLDKVIDAILKKSRDGTEGKINCTNAMYLNKCFLEEISKLIPSFDKYTTAIRT